MPEGISAVSCAVLAVVTSAGQFIDKQIQNILFAFLEEKDYLI